MNIDTYAAALALLSDRIVQAVHDERPDRVRAELVMTTTLTLPVGVDPVAALVTVLAAQVLPTLPLEARLGWVESLGRSLGELRSGPTDPPQDEVAHHSGAGAADIDGVGAELVPGVVGDLGGAQLGGASAPRSSHSFNASHNRVTSTNNDTHPSCTVTSHRSKVVTSHEHLFTSRKGDR